MRSQVLSMFLFLAGFVAICAGLALLHPALALIGGGAGLIRLALVVEGAP